MNLTLAIISTKFDEA